MIKLMLGSVLVAMLLAGCGGGGGDLCKDGWETPSKGEKGACSSHGGLA